MIHKFRKNLIPVGLIVMVAMSCGCAKESSANKPPQRLVSEVSDDPLRERIDEVLDMTFARRLNLQEHAAWQIIHGAVAFKRSFLVERNGERVPAVDYVLAGGRMKGWEFVPGDMLGERRGLRSILESGSKAGQGHPDQWFGYLAGCGLPPDQTIVVNGVTYTLEDVIYQAEWDVPRNVTQEYSWTVMGLSAYRPSNYAWTASDGKRWSLEKLIEIECGHDLNTSACGGSHRLVGLTVALNRHLEQGGELRGAWALADQRIRQSVESALKYQNPDGSLSANFFSRPGTTADLAQSLGATGHALEFLVLAMTDDEVRGPAVRRAVLFLCDAFERTKDIPLECGALYHSASGLVLYRERLFGPRSFGDSPSSPTVATSDGLLPEQKMDK